MKQETEKQKPIIVEFRNPDSAEAEGLEDGGHTHVHCSNCRAGLMDLWITRPSDDVEFKVQATCPWCGDKSFQYDVKGGMHYGGFGRPKPDDEDETIPSTQVVNTEFTNDGIFLFKIEKYNNEAKPVYKK